jgi:uncharacterized protein
MRPPVATENDLSSRIAAFLDTHHVMSLATLGPDGPYAASLFYARDGLALIWISDSASRHSIHIASRPEVAATIAFDYHDFVEIEGLQVFGRARRIADGAQRLRARDRLHARYPFLERILGVPQQLRAAYDRAQIYRLEPARIVLIDNRRGFGSKEVLDLDASPSRSDA